jgi:hypothetical protein
LPPMNNRGNTKKRDPLVPHNQILWNRETAIDSPL